MIEHTYAPGLTIAQRAALAVLVQFDRYMFAVELRARAVDVYACDDLVKVGYAIRVGLAYRATRAGRETIEASV